MLPKNYFVSKTLTSSVELIYTVILTVDDFVVNKYVSTRDNPKTRTTVMYEEP